jgi:hypothetical protein
MSEVKITYLTTRVACRQSLQGISIDVKGLVRFTIRQQDLCTSKIALSTSIGAFDIYNEGLRSYPSV